MRILPTILLSALLAAPMAQANSSAEGKQLVTGEEMRRLVTQNRFFLSAPFGGELPLT